MKNYQEIFNNGRLRFLEFIRTRDGRCIIGGDTIEPVSKKLLNYKFTRSIGWEHLSVSMPNKCPTWEQMCFMKEQFWGDDEVCFQLHPKKADYINHHSYCLHIWKPVSCEVPTPPRIMVGIKDSEDIGSLVEACKAGGIIKENEVIKDEMFIPRRIKK